MAVTINYSFPENQLRALYLDEHKKILDLLILMRKEIDSKNAKEIDASIETLTEIIKEEEILVKCLNVDNCLSHQLIPDDLNDSLFFNK